MEKISTPQPKKYSKDLGHWGLKDADVDKLKKELNGLEVEFKGFEIDPEEFPTLEHKSIIEGEFRSTEKDAKAAIEILKKYGFHLEKFHIANLKMLVDEFNKALLKPEKMSKDVNPWSKENIEKYLEAIGVEKIQAKEVPIKIEGYKAKGVEFSCEFKGVKLYGWSSPEMMEAEISWEPIKHKN